MPVGDLGPEEVTTARPDSPVREVVSAMETAGVGAIVVTENDKPVGIVTDRDIALAVPDGNGIADKPVSSVMAPDPVTIREDADAMEISRTIEEHHVRRIPVVDAEGRLTGIVTLDDLVATIGEQLENVADTIEVQSPEYSP